MIEPFGEHQDRRVRLRNMQLVQLKTPDEYVARSRVTQFVSTNDNIGNYMPVLAIQQMLGEETDCWNIHRSVDWDFVNSNYEFAVIGGAGLLHKTFTQFWKEFDEHCKIPYVIWGVGICDIDGQAKPSYCAPDVATPVFAKALAVNVRDKKTAELYKGNRTDINISECPTVLYLKDFQANQNPAKVTLATHHGLVSDSDHDLAKRTLEAASLEVILTDNVQTPEVGLIELIESAYTESGLVVTSRLHGAITAYALGIPYIAIAGDEKLREFARLFGGGQSIDSVLHLEHALERVDRNVSRPDLKHIEAFGASVRLLIANNAD